MTITWTMMGTRLSLLGMVQQLLGTEVPLMMKMMIRRVG